MGKSHPHRQKESGVLRTASVGNIALGQVTAQAWDPIPRGPTGHNLPSPPRAAINRGLFVTVSQPPDPLDLVAGITEEREEMSQLKAFLVSLPSLAAKELSLMHYLAHLPQGSEEPQAILRQGNGWGQRRQRDHSAP